MVDHATAGAAAAATIRGPPPPPPLHRTSPPRHVGCPPGGQPAAKAQIAQQQVRGLQLAACDARSNKKTGSQPAAAAPGRAPAGACMQAPLQRCCSHLAPALPRCQRPQGLSAATATRQWLPLPGWQRIVRSPCPSSSSTSARTRPGHPRFSLNRAPRCLVPAIGRALVPVLLKANSFGGPCGEAESPGLGEPDPRGAAVRSAPGRQEGVRRTQGRQGRVCNAACQPLFTRPPPNRPRSASMCR
jgi:hypothetical protein